MGKAYILSSAVLISFSFDTGLGYPFPSGKSVAQPSPVSAEKIYATGLKELLYYTCCALRGNSFQVMLFSILAFLKKAA